MSYEWACCSSRSCVLGPASVFVDQTQVTIWATPPPSPVASAIGAGVAESVTLPVDVAKVRLQTQVPRADGSLLYRNMVQGMFVIGKNEGRTALWKGLAPALLRQMSYTSLSFVIYSPIRDLIAGENVEKDDILFQACSQWGSRWRVVDHVHEPDRGRQDTNADEHGAAKNQTDH